VQVVDFPSARSTLKPYARTRGRIFRTAFCVSRNEFGIAPSTKARALLPRSEQCSSGVFLVRTEIGLERAAHHHSVHVDARPIFNANHALVHDHAQSIDHSTASRLTFANKSCAGRVRDHVSDYKRRMQARRVEIEAVIDVWIKTDGGGVDENVGLRRNLVSLTPDNEFCPRLSLAVEQFSEIAASLLVAVYHEDTLCPCEGEFDANGPRRAAGAEHDNGFARWVCDLAQRLDEALAIGIFADELVAAPHRAVDRPHDRS